MATKFETPEQVAEYLSGDTIQCLECSKWFTSLTGHVKRAHGMSIDDYKIRYGIHVMAACMGRSLRETFRGGTINRIADGSMNYDHLPNATEAARAAQRPKNSPAAVESKRRFFVKTQMWNKNRLPPGAKRADGRDADRAREYQRMYVKKRQSQKSNDK